MLAIEFKFTANRYHATQWGRHVNEGVLEWPPSPWRILRAIVSAWRRTAPDLPAETVGGALELLASEPPNFRLPIASPGHTRHYMPRYEGTKERTDLVIDSFVAVCPGEPLMAVWPNVELSEPQRTALAAILKNMGYLGRAESWCDASIADNVMETNCHPLTAEHPSADDSEIVRVLVPDAPLKLRDLFVETGELRRGGRINPPGARWVHYVRRADCLTPDYRASGPSAVSSRSKRPEVVRLALAGSVLPLVTDAMRVGELARRSAMSCYGRANDHQTSDTLSGKVNGEKATGHRHAFYLPTDDDGDGRLDHLTIWAPSGFDDRELDALAGIDALNFGGGRDPIQVVYQGHGSTQDFEEASAIFRPSHAWRSVTPYIPTRHTKLRGKGIKTVIDSPEDQVRREVSLRDGLDAEVAEVQIYDRRQRIVLERHQGFLPYEFYRWRRRGYNAGGAFNVRLTLDSPVSGPLALGFGCHYGLGLFVPDRESWRNNLINPGQ